MLLRKLVSDVEEENSRLANMKLSLEESCEQVTNHFHYFTFSLSDHITKVFFKILFFFKLIFKVWFDQISQFKIININVRVFKVSSNILDKTNDIKQLREQIRKLDERLDCDMQVKNCYITTCNSCYPPNGAGLT